MKKIYSILMMLTMMGAALSFTACGGDDSNDVDNGSGGYDDNQYCHVFINGEEQTYNNWGSYFYAYFDPYIYRGVEVYYYGGIASHIMISYQDAMDLNIYAGYTSTNIQTVFPKSEGTYDIIIRQPYDEYYDDNVGMNITGGNMKYRTVSSGSLTITKVSKCKSRQSKMLYGREDGYATEGSFSFTLTDNWDGNVNVVSGEFRLIF